MLAVTALKLALLANVVTVGVFLFVCDIDLNLLEGRPLTVQ